MEHDPTELERRIYNLKTLCDVSKEVFRCRDTEEILNRFLLMTMGSIGIERGFILIQAASSGEVCGFIAKGFTEEEEFVALASARQLLDVFPSELESAQGFQECRDYSGMAALSMCFTVEEALRGVIGLGPKMLDLPYCEDDKELLLAIVNNLIAALANAEYFKNSAKLFLQLRERTESLEKVLGDLDSKVYHLKTLYDVSKDIFSSVDTHVITRNFLLMTMGGLGVSQGFVALCSPSGAVGRIEQAGFEEDQIRSCMKWLQLSAASDMKCPPAPLSCCLPFELEEGCHGYVGIGQKLLDVPFDEHDSSLFNTLVNNLVIALRNARSFEKISELNEGLREALRKVELLESIKANLCKFVPTTVANLIEKSPTDEIRDASEQDVSVMFLDIEGYSRMTERIGAIAVTRLIEKVFSGFMEPIYAHHGDVVETAGDGLLVLFLHGDTSAHALEAVQAAVEIQQNTDLINRGTHFSEPVLINIGICSGHGFVGATKFESITGSRWTYTAHGNTTNIAARLCSIARGGQLLVAGSTFERVKDCFSFSYLGDLALKNISGEVPAYSVEYKR